MRTNTKTIHQVLRNLLIGFAILFSLSLQAVQAQSAPAYLRTILPDARLQGSGNRTWFGLKRYSAAQQAASHLICIMHAHCMVKKLPSPVLMKLKNWA